jgi:L-asparagine oxygenase
MNWIDYRTSNPLNYSRTKIADFPEQNILDLSEEEYIKIQEESLAITSNPYKLKEREHFIESTKKIISLLSENKRKHIINELDWGFGAMLITGLPTDQNLPPTPVKGGALSPEYKQSFICEALLYAIGMMTGAEAFNFRQEGRGSAPLIDNIVPVQELRSQKGAGGYENNFPFHCESAWHRKRPDYLVLLGIRESPIAKTLVFSSQMLKSYDWQINEKNVEGWFRLRAPDLYLQMANAGMPLGTPMYGIEPPIRICESEIKLNINFNGTDCRDQDAIAWLRRLEDYIESKAVGTIISPGSALILNNHLTCHTRTGYTPLFDGKDRWFLRGYFKKNLWEINNDCSLSDEKLLNQSDVNDLIDIGWMTKTGVLSSEFEKYIYEPNQIMELSKRRRELANIAMHFTPVNGSRIV